VLLRTLFTAKKNVKNVIKKKPTHIYFNPKRNLVITTPKKSFLKKNKTRNFDHYSFYKNYNSISSSNKNFFYKNYRHNFSISN
jgi:hypothetical protein